MMTLPALKLPRRKAGSWVFGPASNKRLHFHSNFSHGTDERVRDRRGNYISDAFRYYICICLMNMQLPAA
jgi:hypothetical protein